ncbi:hypothetical protein DFH09DRAFT_1069020 [Mycena vulgaris]|nr:hypothetical protein DFH09DRAFT_1069020 [Mycena vulgaris]
MSYAQMPNVDPPITYRVSTKDHTDFIRKIDEYVAEMRDHETDLRLQERVSKRLAKFLDSLHSSGSALKDFVYSVMNGRVDTSAADDKLMDIWADYKANSTTGAAREQGSPYTDIFAASSSPRAIPQPYGAPPHQGSYKWSDSLISFNPRDTLSFSLAMNNVPSHGRYVLVLSSTLVQCTDSSSHPVNSLPAPEASTEVDPSIEAEAPMAPGRVIRLAPASII